MDTSSTENVVIQCAMSDSFQRWLSELNGSMALTTYQAGKVAFIGWDGRQVNLLLRNFDKPMGHWERRTPFAAGEPTRRLAVWSST